MLTLRIIPPRLIASHGRPDPRDLTALYIATLRDHWGAADRGLATALSLSAAARPGVGRTAWAHGWDAAEEALNHGAPDRTAHLGMQARKGLNRIVNPGAYPLEANPLKNKRLFAQRARGAGLPVPHDFSGSGEALAAWLAGETAVVAKPNFASKGAGVAGFRRCAGGWESEGARIGAAEAVALMRRIHRAGGVIQRACPTHPGLRDLSPGALPTLRVMTAVDERGGIEICDRIVRLSAGGVRAVDNFNAGNIVAGIDAAGRIGSPYSRTGARLVRLDRHPTTGARLEGADLPDLDAASALAARAHGLLADGFRVVGWDIGLTAEGPVLIEGNWNPGTDILQLTSGLGVGDTRLGEIYRRHIAATPGAVWAAARPVEREPHRASPRDPSAPNSGRSARAI